MNFAKRMVSRCAQNGWGVLGKTFILVAASVCLLGCSDQVRMPTAEELAAFEKAGSIAPTVDMDRIQKAKLKTGPYRVVPGDVLEFTMPSLLQAVTAAEVKAAQAQRHEEYPYLCRVSDSGTITLPAIGEMEVLGQSLAQIEAKVVDAYQEHVILRPSVFVRVSEYKTCKIYIAGAVEEPGVYELQADQMTISYLLTQAGGIAEAGAAVLRIVRSDDGSTGQSEARPPIVVPVAKGNIPYQDYALEEGDTVVVEPSQMPLFSVLGLVQKPGNFDYEPGAQYNLTQAIAYAGGLDPIADPRYVTIYRLAQDGSVIRVPFQLIKKGEFTDALGTPIRPGDVVAIEHTPRTRTTSTIKSMVRFNTGLYIYGRDIWGD